MNPELIREFAKEWYYSSPHKTWDDVWWMGKQILKCPMDLWVYQEIIYDTRPDIIIECGTGWGGSTLFLANILDLCGIEGNVYSIDIKDGNDPEHPRPSHPKIHYIKGSSTHAEVVNQLLKNIRPKDKVMVILDSDHRGYYVLEELMIYSNIVTKGMYLIVEDTQLNHQVDWNKDTPGPMEALKEFLCKTDRYESDEKKEKFYLTFNPKGFLKKLR